MTAARHVGLPVRTAREQLQRTEYPSSPLEPLPAGTPGRTTGEQVGITDPGSTMSFIVLGDTGGIMDPAPQKAVAAAIGKLLPSLSPAPAFVYHVGDIAYFNGDPGQWAPQFYEPYAHTLAGLPIVAIPGNHDGDSSDGVAGSGIASFIANLCSKAPANPPGDPDLEYGRSTQTQPYCDWTLQLEALTIIGVWSNVPSGGHLYPQQVEWLTGELKAAAADVPLLVAVHHPPYSVDAHHGGSQKIGDLIDECFEAAGRWPDMVLSGHVHDMQRFTRTTSGRRVTYLVQGGGGYHNLHELAGDATPGLDVLGDGSVIFEQGLATAWGFTVVTVSPAGITGVSYSVDNNVQAVATPVDRFELATS